jgi:hypothetical protein
VLFKKLLKNKVKALAPLSFLHTPRPFSASIAGLKKFHNKFDNETCIIIGNGPSLNLIDFELVSTLKTFAVNGIFYKTDELGFVPSFYVVEDGAVMKDNKKLINDYEPEIASFFPSIYRSSLEAKSNRFFFTMDRRFYERRSYNFEVPQFSKNVCRKIYCNQSVTFINFQLAYYMGFKKIILVGMDHSYKIPDSHIRNENKIVSNTDDPNHFHPDYFGVGKTWHDPQLQNVELSYRVFNEILTHQGVDIVNCTVGGKLEVFRRSKLENEI